MKRLPIILAVLLLASAECLLAHSGRTDSQGGHHDRRYGGYHFHHGMGPHQHPGGVCPYSGGGGRSSGFGTRADNRNWFERHPILTGIGGLWVGAWAWNAVKGKGR